MIKALAAYIIAAFIREPRKICGTSVKIIQLNEYGCRDAPCEKSWNNHSSDKGLRMIVLVSLIVLLRGFPCFHDFSHGASLHPYSFN